MITTTGGGFPRFLGVIHVSLPSSRGITAFASTVGCGFQRRDDSAAGDPMPDGVSTQSTQRIHPHISDTVKLPRKTKDRT